MIAFWYFLNGKTSTINLCKELPYRSPSCRPPIYGFLSSLEVEHSCRNRIYPIYHPHLMENWIQSQEHLKKIIYSNTARSDNLVDHLWVSLKIANLHTSSKWKFPLTIRLVSVKKTVTHWMIPIIAAKEFLKHTK